MSDAPDGSTAPETPANEDGKPANEPEWKPPSSQADLDKIINRAVARTHAQYGMTADEAKALKEQIDALEAEGASDAEKREKQARKTALEEQDAKYRPMMAETAFRVAIGDSLPAADVDDFIADTNLARFITDAGQVDTPKVLARVAQLTGTTSSTTQQRTTAPRGPVIPGHNPGTNAPVRPGDGARAALAKIGIKVD